MARRKTRRTKTRKTRKTRKTSKSPKTLAKDLTKAIATIRKAKTAIRKAK